jgi:hypothetical protein
MKDWQNNEPVSGELESIIFHDSRKSVLHKIQNIIH